MSTDIENLFKDKVLGHPAGLFVLFFTEMWERFSFYGMRVLLVNFLTMAAISYNPGWEWTAENAGALFGTYAMLLYITPIIGGYIADKYTGYRWAVIIGALIMTLGHASMAIETEASLYIGLALLVIGTGFFKPTMTSIISEMYKKNPEKKDGAYTIYYMGVNAGAFFGMMLCGYLAEKVGWAWGFGLAGIFMLLGTLQFWLAGSLFGNIGAKPTKVHEVELPQNINEKSVEIKDDATEVEEKPNPFTLVDKVLMIISAIIGLGYAFNDPLSKIGGIDMFSAFQIKDIEGQYVAVLVALALFLFLVISRISRYTRIVRDRMIAFIIFAFFTVFFWLAFEQGASSLVLFARDNVDRSLTGNSAIIFNVINTLLTVIPLIIISWVLYLLWKKTYSKIGLSNIVLVVCFLLMWALVGWMLNRDFNTVSYDITYDAVRTNASPSSYGLHPDRQKQFEGKLLGGSFAAPGTEGKALSISIDSIVYQGNVLKQKKSESYIRTEREAEQKSLNEAYVASVVAIKDTENANVYYTDDEEVKKIPLSKLYYDMPISEGMARTQADNVVQKETSIAEPTEFTVGQELQIIKKDNEGTSFGYLDEIRLGMAKAATEKDNGIITAKVTEIKSNEVEITVSWFSILNSFFIIVFASFFSKWWESKYNPTAATKYALGLIIMAVGFGLLAFGSYGISEGVKVSMIWLILAYLFHTLGELCLSPVGLSYVSKLVPARMIAFMFGMWYLAIAIGNKLAAVIGGQIENITKEYDLFTFFMIFTIVPAAAGLLVWALNPLLKKLMHGVK
ncbi:peptide MFS transporter [Kordia algicida OT-1]|uniref:Proton/peptide symporter family protein n=1 Tax=Kordia algicida OT-1 TaxID=391587 RepID=A9DK47_9FLAO|nr:peptide MFS transporter [Kordia algicida]EDP98256.1 proton/peptide symporter family protein [Kordia algicida OT-1]